MRVQLRILPARHPMPVGGRYETESALGPDSLPAARQPSPPFGRRAVVPTPDAARLRFHIRQRRVDGVLVRLHQRLRKLRVADGEENADALRGRERQVERGDLRASPADRELLPGARVLAGHHRHQLLSVQLP
ncbi:MAG TPA: hypothetical protein VMF09_16840 [Solirubrobacteraceae bacterium]|nr:hypothetical protein [Solirubrobacteraceae bacterium]